MWMCAVTRRRMYRNRQLEMENVVNMQREFKCFKYANLKRTIYISIERGGIWKEGEPELKVKEVAHVT